MLIFPYFTGWFHIFLWSLYWKKYLFLFILKQSLEDVIQGSCSKSMLNELKYTYENVLFLLKLQPTLLKLSFFTGIFFKDFENKNNLTLCRTTILQNIYFCKTPSSMAASVHSLNSSYTYFFYKKPSKGSSFISFLFQVQILVLKVS